MVVRVHHSKSSSSSFIRIVNVDLEKVRESNMSFLKGFVQVMKPIAVAMDLLQGEKNAFLVKRS